MPDVFTKAKRSEVMSRIRSRGNERTEVALIRVFQEQGIIGWRRHVQLRIDSARRPSPSGRLRRSDSLRSAADLGLRISEKKQKETEKREMEGAVVREEGGGYRVEAKSKAKQPARASSRRLLQTPLKVRPDFVFRERKLAVFVDGCFWHGCAKCYIRPEQNQKFWDEKWTTNRARDRKVNRALKAAGWRVLRIWEHELKRKHAARLLRKLGKVLAA